MNDETTIPQKKLRLLGNILLVVACICIIGGLLTIPVSIFLTSSYFPELMDSFQEVGASPLPADISPETTVRELMERDRVFLDGNRQTFQKYAILGTGILILNSVLILRLALAWRRADAFGRITIIGLRCLGALMIVQFLGGLIAGSTFVQPTHEQVFNYGLVYDWPVTLLLAGPNLSAGIIFLILSWVLEYGSKIKEEQALTI